MNKVIEHIESVLYNNFSRLTLVFEITNIKCWKDKIIFLELIDQTIVINSTLWKQNYFGNLKIGDKIEIIGDIGLYKCQLRLKINSYRIIGTGNKNSDLQQIVCRYKKKGYFDNKKEIKTDYARIAIISSMESAGIKDFISILCNRCFGKKLFIYDCGVQGCDAPIQIKKSIENAVNHDISDILVLIRGGGSKDDLACFNSEIIAMSIINCPKPFVTGIGHQIDNSLCDMVSDKSFITPSQVAQSITFNYVDHILFINEKNNQNISRLQHYFNSMYKYLYQINLFLVKFATAQITKYFDHHNLLMIQYANLIEKIALKIERYNKKLELITTVQIFDDTGNKINLLSDINTNSKSSLYFIIKFLDGEIKIPAKNII
jgi:exodeoxyribonuclease VII large subunit